jgi:hypothetical protein
MNTKRFVIAALICLMTLLMIGVALYIATPSTHRYRTDSLVLATPFTNALLARSFEAQVIRTIPGVLRLQVSPSFSLPAPGLPAATNGMALRIVAFGRTPEEAKRAANEAATQLSRTVLTNYGVTGEIADMATGARRYSYFHDSFEPAVGRIFKH